MQAGFYESDITPFFDTRNAVAYDHGTMKGVKTPFSFSAGVFEAGGRTVALVGADMIVLDRPLVDYALEQLRARLPLDSLVVGASHTHANACTMDWLLMSDAEIRAMEDLTPAARERIVKDIGRVGRDYRVLLEKRLVDAVYNAWLRREDVRLVAGRAIVDNVAFNRRQKLKSGLTVTHGGKGNPEIAGNAGPVDTQLTALGAVNAAGTMLGAVVNFGCHGTVTAEGFFSADWPYHMRETVKRNWNPRMTVVFLNGCCGDVTQIDNLDPAPEPRTERRAMVLGERVGLGAVEALRAPEPEPFETVACATRILPVPYRAIPEARYREALDKVNGPWDEKKDRWLIGYYARDTVLLVNRIRQQPLFACELNAVQIGNALLLTTPAEMFAQMAIDLKAASPFPVTMVSELTNGHAGYVPTPEAFGPGGGGYEPRFGGASFLEAGAFDKIRAALLEMLAGFRPERPPAAPAPKGKPWVAYRPEEL